MEQIIRLTGRIAKVLPLTSGVSQRTGNSWHSQEYVFEYFSWSGATRPDRLVFRIFGEDRIKQFDLHELEENVTVTLRIDAREFEGRYYNEIGCTAVSRGSQGDNIAQMGNNTTATQQTPQAAQNPTAAGTNQEGNADDLPF